MDEASQNPEIRMDAEQLAREDVFTDSRIGTIRRLTPVTADGADDPSRPIQYVGSTQILTPAGPLPISFEIAAGSLQEAVDGFGDAAKAAVENTMEELKELQRQAASSIVVPKAGMDPGGLGGAGGMGGGKIHLP
ncbi:MAG: hypothetical protein GTN86_02165 [Xanthomonadales bacterium]|nr:hypothetical protein [Xanthomonadales bacterium]NIN58818.1 hypothetical protein [Xanthomonadales bacterium]NIN74086.1 hypothetical protein [Xanthomonadales bacterium]NIO14619.1 hypothetical protein [Xanthomonadales bacterium]NIP11211.1 hypothetical protein [Xanthomonadales bacterium]